MFFVETGELDRLEILAYIELVTDNFKLDRLKILFEEVHYHTLNRRDEIEFSYRDQIQNLVKQYQEQGKELPVKIIKIFKDGDRKLLDTDKLLGGAITWDLYPLYELQREIASKIKQAKQAHISKQNQPHSKVVESDFYYLLTDEGKKAYSKIIELYSSVKFKKEYAIMLHALNELNYLTDKHFTGQEQLHKALEATFKNVGRRQNLFKYLNDYSKPNVSERQEIDRHKQRILDTIKKGTINPSANN